MQSNKYTKRERERDAERRRDTETHANKETKCAHENSSHHHPEYISVIFSAEREDRDDDSSRQAYPSSK